MKRMYWIARIVGYVGMLAGVIFFTTGRQDGANLRAQIGAALLLTGFAAFIFSYVLYAIQRMRHR